MWRHNKTEQYQLPIWVVQPVCATCWIPGTFHKSMCRWKTAAVVNPFSNKHTVARCSLEAIINKTPFRRSNRAQEQSSARDGLPTSVSPRRPPYLFDLYLWMQAVRLYIWCAFCANNTQNAIECRTVFMILSNHFNRAPAFNRIWRNILNVCANGRHSFPPSQHSFKPPHGLHSIRLNFVWRPPASHQYDAATGIYMLYNTSICVSRCPRDRLQNYGNYCVMRARIEPRARDLVKFINHRASSLMIWNLFEFKFETRGRCSNYIYV